MKLNYQSTKCLKMKLKKKTQLKKKKKNNSSQLGITFQTCDRGHENEITPWKNILKNNYKAQFPTNPILKD